MNVVTELAKPFPDKFVHDDGRGNAYVPHHVVTQRLIHIFGRPPKIEVLREVYDDTSAGRVLTGVVVRMTLPFFAHNDFVIEEAGEADNPQAKTNGARLKSTVSDAVKRCAMRMGLGLHLWAQDDYFLYGQLIADTNGSETPRHGTQGDPAAGSDNARHETPGNSEVAQHPSPEPGGEPSDTGEGPPPAPKKGEPTDNTNPALTALRIAYRKACKTKGIDAEAFALETGTKLDDMALDDVQLLIQAVGEQS